MEIDWSFAVSVAVGLVIYRVVWALVAGVIDGLFGDWLVSRGVHPYRKR